MAEPTIKGESLSSLIDQLIELDINGAKELRSIVSSAVSEKIDIRPNGLVWDPSKERWNPDTFSGPPIKWRPTLSNDASTRAKWLSGGVKVVSTAFLAYRLYRAAALIWKVLVFLSLPYWVKRLGKASWGAASKVATKMYQTTAKLVSKDKTFESLITESDAVAGASMLARALATLRSHFSWISSIPKFKDVARKLHKLLSMFPGNVAAGAPPAAGAAVKIFDILKAATLVTVAVKLLLYDDRWAGKTMEVVMDVLGLKRVPAEFATAQSLFYLITALKNVSAASEALARSAKIVKRDIVQKPEAPEEPEPDTDPGFHPPLPDNVDDLHAIIRDRPPRRRRW